VTKYISLRAKNAAASIESAIDLDGTEAMKLCALWQIDLANGGKSRHAAASPRNRMETPLVRPAQRATPRDGALAGRHTASHATFCGWSGPAG